MISIYIGHLITLIGISMIVYGIMGELDKKMENDTGYKIQTNNFCAPNLVQNGKKVDCIKILIAVPDDK